jgi:putative transcriptional regulator
LVFGGLLGVVYVHYSLTTKILHSCGWCKRLVVFLSGIGSDPERRVALKLPRLKEVREGRGWSQKKLAEESGVSRDSISNYETGHREAWPATAKKLADALDVEIADLREPTRELAIAGKAEAPGEAGPTLLDRAQDAAHQDQEKSARAVNRLFASQGMLKSTNIMDFEEDRLRAELRELGFPDEHFEDFIWPLVVKAVQADQLEQENARLREEAAALRERERIQ